MGNQTEESWLFDVSKHSLGTGLFLAFENHGIGNDFHMVNIPTHAKYEGQSLKKLLMPNCLYLECVEAGDHRKGVIVFKWIPHQIALEQKVKVQARACGKILCVKRCAGYGCLCIEGICQ